MSHPRTPVRPNPDSSPSGEVPATLRWMVWCGVVSIAALLALPVVMTFDRAGVQSTIIAANPDLDPGQLQQAWLGTLIYSYGLHLVATAVLIWLGWKVLRRRNWARVALTAVLVLLLGGSLVSATAGTMYLWAVIVGDLTFVLGMLLLWAPPSTRAYFRSGRVDSDTSRTESHGADRG